MSDAEDPRNRFGHLPEPIRPDEMVETSDVEPRVEDEPVKPVWEQVAVLGGPGLP